MNRNLDVHKISKKKKNNGLSNDVQVLIVIIIAFLFIFFIFYINND